ncbi:MAG: TraR/DksA C4-type zinc finger protein [Rhodospirillales bacterium]|jgi:DnaK suppressor protein|nr:TraR/DksA C4-type zinc finger protein [Rhodospirillales bacterium]MDP6883330.1 TraR/DksA C4-type zinc finger protein [Rhodospirillales bacterium]
MAQRKKINVKTQKAKLIAHREELERVGSTGADARRPVELDQTRVGRLSRMDALQDQAMALETDRRRGIEIKRIEAALKRIEDGEYGFCLSCGEDIPAERLELDPATPVCVDCAGD